MSRWTALEVPSDAFGDEGQLSFRCQVVVDRQGVVEV
jgi:hypothetical protein